MDDLFLVLGGWLVVSVPLALVVGRCIATRDRRGLRPGDAWGLELERLLTDQAGPPADVVDLTDTSLARRRGSLRPG